MAERSVQSARESIRWLLRQRGAYVDTTGLRIERNPVLSPEQLDVDEILERLEILDVPASVAVMRYPGRRPGRRSGFEVRVALDDLHLLGRHLPDINTAVDQIRAETDGAIPET